MIHAAIFDVDGTLLDSMPIWDDAAAIFLRKHKITAEPELGRKLYPMSMEEGAAYLQKQYNLQLPAKEIINGVSDIISDFYFKEAPLKPFVKTFLESFKRNGIPMTVATSNTRTLVEAAFQRLELSRYFTALYTCAEIGAGKTEPDIFKKAAAAMQTSPQETWVFEDSFYAAQTARKAGFRVAGVYDASGIETLQQLRENSDIYIGDFSDFEGFYRKTQQEVFL